MNGRVTIESLFELALELRDKGEIKDAIAVLTKILVDHPHHSRLHGVHSILGGIYSDLKNHLAAHNHFQIATKLKPESELASFGFYIACYPADMYKDTLKEPLEGLKDGYMSDYEEVIRNLAKKNNVWL